MPSELIRFYDGISRRWRILLAIIAMHLSVSYAQPYTPNPITTIAAGSRGSCCSCIFDDRYPAQIDKFQAQCLQWQQAPEQRHCTIKQNIALKRSLSASSYLPNCDRLTVEYKGHTTSTDDIMVQAEACLAANPHCTLFKYNSTGCSVFADRESAKSVALNIQQLLPTGCRAEVSAHQCNVITNKGGELVTSTKTQYLINQQGVACVFPRCNPIAGHCDPSSGNTAFSCLDRDILVTQSCCSIRGIGQWVNPGQPCPGSTIPPPLPAIPPSSSSPSVMQPQLSRR